MFVEKVSQLYRMTLPMLPWMHYLFDDQEIGRWFAILTVIIYTLFKVNTVNPFTASCENAMTLSVPGIPASCEKFPHSSQLNF
jgi:hypothetical protein